MFQVWNIPKLNTSILGDWTYRNSLKSSLRLRSFYDLFYSFLVTLFMANTNLKKSIKNITGNQQPYLYRPLIKLAMVQLTQWS